MQTGTHDYGTPEGGFPDYTDPEDMRRLRAVTSDKGWQPDRDDADAVKLGQLYKIMDTTVAAYRGGQASEAVTAAQAANVWDEIRRLMRGN